MSDEQTEKRRGSFWRELPILLGVAILVAVLVRAFVLQTFYIPSPSMEHTLNINDRVLVNKLVYDFLSPHRGEIVVFKAPLDWRSNPNEEDFIGHPPAFDWAIVRLGAPGVVRKIEIDTNHYKGNFPESASIEGALAPGASPAVLQQAPEATSCSASVAREPRSRSTRRRLGPSR